MEASAVTKKQAHHGEELPGGVGSVEGEECRIDVLPIRDIGQIPVQIKPQWIPLETVTIKGLKGRLLGGANDLCSQKMYEKHGRQPINFSRSLR
jgi:hypothetical protein